jgi:hypothetical protein
VKRRIATAVAALSLLGLFLGLGLAVSAVAGEYRVFLPAVRSPAPPYALQFDGLDDFASIADKGDFDFDQAFTIEAWIKPLSKQPYDGTIEDIGLVWGADSQPPIHWANYRGWGFLLEAWHGEYLNEISFVVCCGEGVAYGASVGPDLEAGDWYHFAGVYDAGERRGYRNGALQMTPPGLEMDLADVNYILLGTKSASFHGLIDEVRIWSVARSEEEIQATWNRSLRGDEPGLVGYWRLDEGSGQAIADATSYQNHGRLGSTTGPDASDPAWVVSDAPFQ